MYKPNKRHLQPLLISNVHDLPEKKCKRLANSWAEDFSCDFFSRIDEEAFAGLYVDYPSRPNVPVNWLVGLETLYTDGPYAGPEIDQALRQHQVEQIQTGINGKILDPTRLHLADFEIEQDEPGIPTHITCPQGQSVPVELSRRGRSYQADFDPALCATCPFHLEAYCPDLPGKKRTTFRLRFTPDQMAVAQRRRKMRQRKLEGKNPRAAIEGTVREVKHHFPAGKLPISGLFRMTCLMISSAAMTNVRRIHHYQEEQRKQARQKMDAERGPNATPQQQDLSFSSFLKTLLTNWRTFAARPNVYIGF